MQEQFNRIEQYQVAQQPPTPAAADTHAPGHKGRRSRCPREWALPEAGYGFEEHREFTDIYLICFALALMAHESVAVLIFGPLLFVLFGRLSWLKAGIMLAAYVVSVLANFGFRAEIPIHLQAMVSDVPATFFFSHYPLRVLLALLLSFKAMWLLVGVGLWKMRKQNRRLMWFCLITIASATASTYIAVDYSRMFSLATVAVVICLISARRHLTPPIYKGIIALIF